ncbi:MAG: peptidase S16 [Methanoregulaceae archaeon]|nr:peptidase S16 [Methanoregulaceae archaeon]
MRKVIFTRERVIFALLIASLVVNATLLAALGFPEHISPISSTGTSGTSELTGQASGQACQNCADLLEFYRSKLNGTTLATSGGTPGLYGFAAIQAPAVMTSVSYVRRGPFIYRQTTQNGSMMNISVEVLPGEGRVLVQTRPLMGIVFQDAANTAVQVARNSTGRDLSASDVIFSIEAASMIPAVDGPSAGALMTVLVQSAILQKLPSPGVTLTGTISPDGHVGAIGGVLEKAQAAKDAGMTLILFPLENSQIIATADQAQQIVDTKDYIEQNIGIRVEYVDNIGDVDSRIIA